jgi:Ca-activated chloride channel family protein
VTVVEGAPRWRRFVPLLLVALAFVAALVAIARPQLRSSERRENASIALVLDISGSMQTDDVKPTRLGAAQAAIRRFLAVLPDRYRTGLVTFAAEPFVAAPLTRNRRQILDTLQYNLGTGRGTAIGDAIARGVELLRPVVAGSGEASAATASGRDADKPVSAILLLSDGAQRGGILQPLEGAARAKSYGIPVYTVALGSVDGSQAPGSSGGGFGGGGFNMAPDPETLRQIAQATGGSAFATSDAERLNGVYERLASRLGTEPAWRPAGHLLLGLAALLALASAAVSLRWVHRLP